MCRAHGTDCIYPRPGESSQRGSVASPRKLTPKSRQAPRTAAQAKKSLSTSTPLHTQQVLTHPVEAVNSSREFAPQTISRPAASLETQSCPPTHEHFDREVFPNLVGIVAEAGDNTSHIVSPAVAEDNDVLESYLSTVPDARRRSVIRSDPNSRRPVRPVLFNTVPRRPLGVSANQSLPATKCELIEKYLEPNVDDVVDLFFHHANICFPIFDEMSFRHVYCTHKENISPALLCNLYANSLIYWENSPTLRSGRHPDIRFIWNQANEALHSELFLSPGISTVMSIILNVCGRPSTSMFGNGGMVGTAVALSNALGLNRDPSNWNIRPMEKKFRIRIWWLVVIHDRWCSLAYGTPLQIHRAQYDVPYPIMDDLCSPNASHSQIAAALVFVSLITLTEVLGTYLQHVYKVSESTPYPPEMSSVDLERLLTDWEESLSGDIRRIILRGTHLNAPGAANFRLAYLAVKLLLRRIQLDLDADTMKADDDDTTSPFYTQAQRAAEEIVHLVKELDESHFRGFWIPVHAFSLTSATTFLLRSGLRRRNSLSNAPLKLAEDMISTLRSHRDRFSWDLADNCLMTCSDLVEKLSSAEAGDDSLSAVPAFQELDFYSSSFLDELLVGFPGLTDTIEI
ncbi:fungal-specific transcription factor domain-containing protein [Aspergillus caelatus]|uniref:Fungal-specific transcription factor domain-containing protein n=2 Tax=Aspergillus subgen. Circumdati TaxID=2720871 RepID=A0A5N6ZPI7_9EURO|nr:fungal-specific transcription factor domain-containing protein [Aspergillus caelatus]KAE8359288.1 fungal-specific transcription factor domain-containing protein [Aspergillus caelatus]KAE8418750.1 fungal-specific transcription factor domain-containing protein [Aspergillus pseudocaelatus]